MAATTTTDNTTPSLSLHVRITIDPTNIPAFLAALRPAYEAVIAEPENQFFEVYQSFDEPGVFKFVENWNCSREWFMNVQLQKEYYKPYLAVTEPMFVKPRVFEFWERMGGSEWVSVKKELFC